MIDIYVIHLADRPDRYKQIITDFSSYTNINLIFIDAIKHNPGHIGCSRSFKKCVGIAKEKQLPYIIIAEDDCMPMNNFENRLQNILEYLESCFTSCKNSARSSGVAKGTAKYLLYLISLMPQM
jgi:GR25 family glycosyltransferase involved in LPS biosynthesis